MTLSRLDSTLKDIDSKPYGWRTLPINHPNYAAFVDEVKKIMDLQCDIAAGYTLTFNEDYSSLKKEPYYTGSIDQRLIKDWGRNTDSQGVPLT